MYDVLRRASMFSILTGLRFSDIQSLRWEELCTAPDGKPCIRKCIQKTDSEETIFISEQALDLCGERQPSGIVFEGFRYSMTNYPLKQWLKAAGITKKISFHCFRHTNATLMVASGVDIYTVSKQLTHAHVKTTEIYMHIVDHKRREASESIVIG
jgi:integrase